MMKAIYSLTQMNDDTLMYLMAKGHMDALEELYNRYWKGIYLEIVKRVKKHDHTERVLEKCLLYVWHNRHIAGKSDTFPGLMNTVIKIILLTEIAEDDTVPLNTVPPDNAAKVNVTYTMLEKHN